MRNIFIVGAGGFGREAIWTIERINAASQSPVWHILGYADDNPKWKKGDNFEGYPILGTVEEAAHDYPAASVFIAIGKNQKRLDMVNRLRGFDFPAIIDPTAQISPTTDFNCGTYVASEAVVQVGSNLGKFCLVGARSIIGHDAELGDFVNLGPGAAIASGVKVGDRASFFANSSTMPGITIGADCWIACGVGVRADLAAGVRVES